MDEIIKLIIEVFRGVLENNPMDFLIYLTTLFLGIWLYKEFRNKIIDEEKIRKEKSEYILMILLDLQFELNEFLVNRNNFQELKEKLVKSYPFLSFELSKEIENFRKNMSKTDIKNFILKLSIEKNTFKANQNDEFSQINEKSLLRTIEYHYVSKFQPIIKPFFLMLFSILIIMVIIVMFITFSEIGSLIEKSFLLLFLLNILIILAVFISISDIIYNKKMVHNFKNWSFIFIFFIFSILISIFSAKIQFLSAVLFLIFLILIVVLWKKGKLLQY